MLGNKPKVTPQSRWSGETHYQLSNPEHFPVNYPDEIKYEVYETLAILAAIEQTIMSEFATEEYVINEHDWMEKWRRERDNN